MAETTDRLAENLRNVRRRIVDAARRAGRDPSAVRLVAVTKYAELEWLRVLVELGATDLGESRPQQLDERVALLPGSVRWHLIGPLQRNKVRRVLQTGAWIHSVDSLRLLAALDRLAEELAVRPRVLLEVNASGEPQKHGFAPGELAECWPQVAASRHAEVAGLMTMAPYDAAPDELRAVFRRTRTLRDHLATLDPALPLSELSMGMSGDFEIAIEEGATIVRVGSLLFDGLPPNS